MRSSRSRGTWRLPAFQGPDEETHFAYVQYLAETGKLPSATSGPSAYSSEVAAAAITLNLFALTANPSGRPAWSRADLDLWHKVESELPPDPGANGSGRTRSRGTRRSITR